MNIRPKLSFENAERFDVPGKGILFAVKCSRDYCSINSLLGSDVLINGEDWHVEGIEHMAGCGIPAVLRFGLLVRKNE